MELRVGLNAPPTPSPSAGAGERFPEDGRRGATWLQGGADARGEEVPLSTSGGL